MEEKDLNETDEEVGNLLDCISICQEICTQTLMHCLDKGGEYVDRNLIQNLIDCTEICQLAKTFFIRESDYAGDILDICSAICQDCSDACNDFDDDLMLRHCADICRDCADACDNIIEEAENEERLGEE